MSSAYADTLQTIWKGLEGVWGNSGSYGAIQRVFLVIGLCALPGSLVINAPFGRFLPAQHSIIHFTLPGNPGWFLMEIFAPLSFIRAFLTPITTTVSRTTGTTPLVPLSAVASLPAARLILAAAFLAHYSNRAVLDPLVRNPARARMAWYVILLGALFNVANGTLLGRWVAGGLLDDSTSQRIAEPARELGLQSGVTMKVLFAVGMAVWALGFAGNIYHDRILYAIKRDKMRQQKQIEKVKSTADGRQQTAEDSKQRYAIPRGGLYEYVSHPSYSTEWFEWTGFLLATLALSPARFPPTPHAVNTLALALRRLPAVLRPLETWYTQPAAIFLANEIAAMLPRAIRGHDWYEQTFGADWPQNRKIVIPFLF